MIRTKMIRIGTKPKENDIMMASNITFTAVAGMNSSLRISLATS